ncbi:MAG: zf-HC2 domain-containing protein [Thiobacillaceae bacterium]
MGLFINCRENSQLVTRSWDRPLSVKDRVAMRIHLFVCVNCARFVRQMNLLREWLRREEAEGRLSEQARTRITTRLQEQGPADH